jgi:hypothetical protein
MKKWGWWWMVFWDHQKPIGQNFVGVIIAEGVTLDEALAGTEQKKTHPGGEVQSWAILDRVARVLAAEGFTDRPLTLQEACRAGDIAYELLGR